MSFLFPQFLWALFALSIPIIIHLFNFRRAKKVYFSNVAMLQHVKQTSSAKQKLKHWLVLAARLLAIFFLVMAFAQPLIPPSQKGPSGSDVVIYLDNSLSMSNSTNEEIAGLDAGVALAQEIIEAYPRETRFQLLTNNFEPFSDHLKSKPEVEELLTRLGYSFLVRSPGEIQGRMNLGRAAADVYWISDFAYPPALSVAAPDTVNNYHLVPLGYRSTSNVLIDTAWLDTPFLIEEQANTLMASLKNTGSEAKNELPVRLFINEIQVAALTTNLAPGERSTISFDLNTGLKTFNKCRISIDDFPVVFDNEFYLSLNQSPRLRILEIKGERAPPAIGQVYGNARLFDLQSFPASHVDHSRAETSELLIINEIEALSSGTLSLISSSLAGGRHVLVIPSPNQFDAGWTQIHSGLKQEAGALLQEIAQPDLANPFYRSIFVSSGERMEMPSADRVISWGNTGDHLLRYRSGPPYLSKLPAGAGSLYLLASSLGVAHSAFAGHALFVPVMYKLAIGARKTTSKLYYTLNEPMVTVNNPGVSEAEFFRLKRTDQELVPAQQVVGSSVKLTLPGFLMKPGFYEANFNGKVIDLVAFNPEKDESLLQPLPHEHILELFHPVAKKEIMDAPTAEHMEKSLKEHFSGKELWKYALILALIFLLVEVLLLRFIL